MESQAGDLPRKGKQVMEGNGGGQIAMFPLNLRQIWDSGKTLRRVMYHDQMYPQPQRNFHSFKGNKHVPK